MPRTIAIGDIHGCNETLLNLLFDKIDIEKDDFLIFLGDYVDRGPDSSGVLDTIIGLTQTGYQIISLRGNHEQMLLEGLEDEDLCGAWLEAGGQQTLASMGIDHIEEIPNIYINFIKSTKVYFQKGADIFVHGTLNFNFGNGFFEDEDELLWGRNFETNRSELGIFRMIHGHTPRPLDYIISQKGNCINLDSGCVYLGNEGFGFLTAFLIEENKFIHCPCIDHITTF